MGSTGIGPFERFIETLRLLYPLMHTHLECERVTDVGLLYHWKGENPALAKTPVVLMAHFDVAPVVNPDAWTHPPFSGMIADDRVWGRGAFDDKGCLVAICEAVESLLTRGFTPERDIYLCFGGNEETRGDAAATMAETLRDRGIRPYLVLDEGGAVVDAPLPKVNAQAAMVGVGEKGVMTIKLTCEGHPGQIFAPSRRTPIARIGGAVARVTSRTFPARLPSAVPAMIAALAPHASGSARPLYSMLARVPFTAAQFFARLGGHAASLAATTVAPTQIEAGTTSDHLPTNASAILNVRIAVGRTVDSTLSLIKRRIADPGVTITIIDSSNPCAESPIDNPQFAAIRAAVDASYPGVVTAPYVMSAATDSRHFADFADAVYRFSPLKLSSEQRPTIHGPDEWVDLDSLHRGQVFQEHLLRSTAG
jgi:carboxypeptidase PM20D1